MSGGQPWRNCRKRLVSPGSPPTRHRRQRRDRSLRATDGGSPVKPADLMAFINRQLTSYKRPSQIIVLEVLPATSTGKILSHKHVGALRGACPTRSEHAFVTDRPDRENSLAEEKRDRGRDWRR